MVDRRLWRIVWVTGIASLSFGTSSSWADPPWGGGADAARQAVGGPPVDGARGGGRVVVGEGSQRPSEEGATLAELLDEALRQSPGLGAATAGVEVARHAARFARFERVPRLEFASRVDYLGPRQELPMRGAVFDLRQLQAPFRYNDTLYRIGASLTVPLYTGGRIEASIGRADLAKAVADEDLRLSREELITQLAVGYYRTLQLREQIRATEASLASLREAQRVVAEQVRVGKAAAVELLKVNTRLAALAQQLIEVQNFYEVSRSRLTVLVGREGFTNKVRVRGPLQYAPRPRDLSEHLDLALRQRPELRSQELAVSMERQGVKLARSALLPNVTVGAFFEGVRGNASELFDQEGALVAVSIPLVSAQQYAELARARVRVRQEEERLRRQRLQIGLEVEEAFLDLDAAEQRLQAAEAALAEAREVLRIEQVKLSVGKGIVQDLLDAQAAALEAETNRARALADANAAWVRLLRATGTVDTLRRP